MLRGLVSGLWCMSLGTIVGWAFFGTSGAWIGGFVGFIFGHSYGLDLR